MWIELRAARHCPVDRLHPAARKYELARHELVVLVTAAKQNFGLGRGAVHQNEGRSILGAHQRRGQVARRLIHAADESFGEVTHRNMFPSSSSSSPPPCFRTLRRRTLAIRFRTRRRAFAFNPTLREEIE